MFSLLLDRALQYLEFWVFPADIIIVYESNLKNIKKKWICLMIKNCVGYILCCCFKYFIGCIVSPLFT